MHGDYQNISVKTSKSIFVHSASKSSFYSMYMYDLSVRKNMCTGLFSFE